MSTTSTTSTASSSARPAGLPQALRALVLRLQARQNGRLDSPVGELANAAFYDLVRRADPALAQALHDGQHRKAFALSPLFGFAQNFQADQIPVQAGGEGWMRVAILDDALFRTFIGHLLDASRPTLRLGSVDFQIVQVLGSPGSHPWVGYLPLADLRNLSPAGDTWTLTFASPMAIGMGKSDAGRRRMELFPHPRAVVAGLRARWDAWSGEAWGRDFEEWVERNVVVSRVWNWRTVVFRYRRQHYVGGIGKVEYRLLGDPADERAVHLHRLLHLAFYTGVGYKTTHGLGMVRIGSQS